MILYRKSPQLRITRAVAPAPPFWFASAIAPYGARRAAPVAIDYVDLRATAAERMEVPVAESVAAELERSGWKQRGDAPVLIDAAEAAEIVFRRGEQALAFAAGAQIDSIYLISTHAALPSTVPPRTTVTVAAWPLEPASLEPLFAAAHERQLDWGITVPIMFPVTTDLGALNALMELSRKYRPRHLAALPLETDAVARQALARSLNLGGDDETYAMLFHADLDPIQVATERHIAALAAEIGVADFVVPPRFEEKTNWNASIVLTLAATRLLAMEHEVELAGMLARSARVVAELDKPLTRIAEAASLSIVEALDEVSVDILSDWLESGHSSFVESVNERWRLRRDYSMNDER